MKKLFTLTSCLLLAICSADAQKPETAQVLIHYKFSHLRDTTHRDNPYKENMVLLLGKTASVYKSYDRQLEDALFKKQMQEQIASSPDGNIKLIVIIQAQAHNISSLRKRRSYLEKSGYSILT